MCSYELAAMAVMAVGSGVQANEQHRMATAPKPGSPTGPGAVASAIVSPEAGADAPVATTRNRLRVDLNSSIPKTGVGLQVTSPRYPGMTFSGNDGVRG